MQDYVNLLLDAINNYNEEDMSSKNKLRDLVCIISENDSLKKDPLIRELLYTASHKMRIFGYNVQNGYYKHDVFIEQNSSELMYLRNQSIIRRYQSKVRSNNILDKSQQSIIDYYQSLDKKRMLVSAPTSYGKTFIMREILYLNQKRYNNVLLVWLKCIAKSMIEYVMWLNILKKGDTERQCYIVQLLQRQMSMRLS